MKLVHSNILPSFQACYGDIVRRTITIAFNNTIEKFLKHLWDIECSNKCSRVSHCETNCLRVASPVGFGVNTQVRKVIRRTVSRKALNFRFRVENELDTGSYVPR